MTKLQNRQRGRNQTTVTPSWNNQNMRLNIGEEASEGQVEEGNKGKGKRNMLWAHDPVSWRQGLYKVGFFLFPYRILWSPVCEGGSMYPIVLHPQ